MLHEPTVPLTVALWFPGFCVTAIAHPRNVVLDLESVPLVFCLVVFKAILADDASWVGLAI